MLRPPFSNKNPAGVSAVTTIGAPQAASNLGQWIAILALAASVSISIMDRTMLNLFIQPIKASIKLSDTQIALMNGVSFGLFYCIFAVIMGRITDRGNRRRIIIWTVFSWALVIVLTGLAKNFSELTICRIALAVAEAALAPAAFSMIADMLPQRLLGRGISTFYSGSILGPGLALVFGGAMNKVFSGLGRLVLPFYGNIEVWRAVVIAASGPGLLVVALVILFTYEPPRRELTFTVATDSRNVFAGVGYLWANRKLYAPFFLSMALISINYVSTLTWAPTYLIRVYGWNAHETGLWLGLVVAIGGVFGALSGGGLADWFVSRGHKDGVVRSMLLTSTLSTPFAFSTIPNLGSIYMLAGIGAYSFFVLAATSTAPALIQIITPNCFRGQVSGLYLTLLNIATLALGPLIVALLTDYVFRNELALGSSLTLLACVAAPLSLVCFWTGQRSLRSRIGIAMSVV